MSPTAPFERPLKSQMAYEFQEGGDAFKPLRAFGIAVAGFLCLTANAIRRLG